MIESIFPTPLYSNIASDNLLADIQKEISNVVEKTKLDYKSDWGKTHKISSLSNNIIQDNNLINFKMFLNENLHDYLTQLGFDANTTHRLESWITLLDTDDYGHIHDHGNADVSGVYYFQTNEQDGDIVFYNPAPQFDMSTILKASTWRHKPMIGKMLLFPGYLKHGIFRNETTSTRISLSFNIFFNK